MSKENNTEELKSAQPKKALGGHFIVGVGASAGGLEAINELFDQISHAQGFSFVVVQHLSPNHKSLMDELLAKHTHMKIMRAEEDMVIRPDHIYLIPSRKNMRVRNGMLHLTDKSETDVPHHTINIFFESLAQEMGEKAIGVVLSGTGSDGTKGLEAIKRAGGLVLVQDPRTAKFDGMPNSAIAAGFADAILSPREMAAEIFRYPEHLHQQVNNSGEDTDEESLLKSVLQLVNQKTTYDFSSYKEQTLSRRLARRMGMLGMKKPQEYLDYLNNQPEEIRELAEEFLIGVTSFFRDPEAFKLLSSNAIDRIIESKEETQPVKVWVVACSTGEEAYTLAMLFCEAMEKADKELSVKIFATDIDPEALEKASKGVYPASIKEKISEERLQKFFVQEGDTYCVNQQIRRMVIFAQHNVIKDPPFSKMDLVSCRNMLIYMKPILQHKVLATFHFALRVGGYLFLGPSESCEDIKSSLNVISKKWNIYQTVSKSKNFMFEGDYSDTSKKTLSVKPLEKRSKRFSQDAAMQDAFQELMTRELGYAALFINENNELIQAIGSYQRFMQMPERVLQLNLLKLLPKELSVALNLALRKAQRNNERISSRRVEVREEDRVRIISLVVHPYLDGSLYPNKFLAILLKEEGSEPISAREEETDYTNQLNVQRLLELENELKQAKIDLQATVEELETSNEEMQSSNEELISSNEELQSTNEELQSVNEELHTVNAEHQQKIRELEELNDDLNNFFRSTEVGQVFLDRKLVIRKFTPASKKQINLIESDIGRPINHLSYNFKENDLLEKIKQVIHTTETFEQEIETYEGNYFLMRIMPYLRQDQTIDGAVITFVDISAVKNLNNLLEGVLESSTNGIMAFRLERGEKDNQDVLCCTLANQAARSIFKLKQERLEGNHLQELLPKELVTAMHKRLLSVARTKKPLHTEFKLESRNNKRWLEIIAVAIEGGMALTVVDISDKKQAENELLEAYEEVKEAEEELRKLNNTLERRVDERTRELSESEERFRLVSRATNDVVWDWNLSSDEFWWNEGFLKIFGHHNQDVEPGVESWFNLLKKEERDQVVKSIHDALNRNEQQWTAEHRMRKADGSYTFVYNRAYIMKNEYGVPYRMLGSMVDLSSLKKAQEELELTNRTLQKINTDLDNFVYTASHDLKAPVANMEGLTSLLQPLVEEKLDERGRRLFSMIDSSVDKLKNTIDALVEITKVQQNFELSTEVVLFEEVLDGIKHDLQNKIDKLQPTIETDFQVPSIRYAPINLRSILYNLLSNSLKFYRQDCPIKISIKTSRLENGKVSLVFSDNGMGISEKNQRKLFSMFKRFHRDVEGTGIGLYMVKRIIENSQGSIRIESKVGDGTTFFIELVEEEGPKLLTE